MTERERMSLDAAVEVLIRVEQKVDGLATDLKSLTANVQRIDTEGTHGTSDRLGAIEERLTPLEVVKWKMSGVWIVIGGTLASAGIVGGAIFAALNFFAGGTG